MDIHTEIGEEVEPVWTIDAEEVVVEASNGDRVNYTELLTDNDYFGYEYCHN